MFIQRGFPFCKRCEKEEGIVPELQWNAKDHDRCLRCNEKLTSSSGTNLFGPVSRLVRAFTETHGFRFDDMGTKKQSPDIAGVADVPQISLSSRAIPGLTATITWQEMPKDGGEQNGKTWKEFTGKHPDLLVPANLTSVVASLKDEFPVTWNNVAGVRKQVRMTRYVYDHDVEYQGKHKLWIELEFCWEVSKQAEAAVRFAKKYFSGAFGGKPPGAEHSQSVRIRDLMPEATALAHMWFGNQVAGDWWSELWVHEAFAQRMDEAVASGFGGVLSEEDAKNYRFGVAMLAALPPDRLAKALAAIKEA